MNGEPKDLESACASTLEVLRVARGGKRPLYCGTNTIEDIDVEDWRESERMYRSSVEAARRIVAEAEAKGWFLPDWYKDQIVYMAGAEERGLEKLQKLQASADKQDGEYITIPIKHGESK